MICTLLRPSKGTILVDDIDVMKDPTKARERIGLVFQETTLDLELTGWQNLDFHARLFKLPEREKRVKEALELVDLMKDKDVICKNYSGGMKRRLEIARSVLHDPTFILLDEPTLGLDPVSRRTMWSHIMTLIEKKRVTVILTTHYLEEAERLCSQIAIMDKGKIVVQGTPDELKSKISSDLIIIHLKQENDDLVKQFKELERTKQIKKLVADGSELTLYVQNASTSIVPLLQHLGEDVVQSIQIKRPSLDDVFLHYAGRKYEEGGK
jgi:ABC-2 type transport system ATP-binding protein